MNTAVSSLGSQYLDTVRALFRSQKALADKALAQLSGEEYYYTPDSESNSIAVLLQHMAGNMISRWTDFLTTDGEKPDRHRDEEFMNTVRSVENIRQLWEQGWNCLFSTLDSLTEADLLRTVFIRHEPHTALQAIERQVSHYGYHVGQIVFLAKHIRSTAWDTLSVPRGKSQEFLDNMTQKYASGTQRQS